MTACGAICGVTLVVMALPDSFLEKRGYSHLSCGSSTENSGFAVSTLMLVEDKCEPPPFLSSWWQQYKSGNAVFAGRHSLKGKFSVSSCFGEVMNQGWEK